MTLSYLQASLDKLTDARRDDVIEICINPDGSCWGEFQGDPFMRALDQRLSVTEVRDLGHQIASGANTVMGRDRPNVSVSITYRDRPIRAQVITPPAVLSGMSISLRFFSRLSLDAIELRYLQADSHLVPTLDGPPLVCPDRPPEPAWLRNIAPREAYKRLLVQQIYRARSMQRIVDTGACSCPTRYPSWEAAEAVFVEQFANAGYWAVTEATSDYRREANRLRLEAMPICEETGNW